MFEDPAVEAFEASTLACEISPEMPCQGSTDSSEPSPEVRSKSSRELADEYGVSDKTIQIWFKAVTAAYNWLEPETLKTGKSAKTRYTPLCQQLIAEYRAAVKELSEEEWIGSVHANNSDKMASRTSFVSAQTAAGQISMIPYQPPVGEMERFTPPDRKIFKYTSTEEFTTQAKKNTEIALDVTHSNSSSLADALVSQMQQEGQKLGLTLFQAKYGTAHSVLAELEQSLAKKSGLAEEVQPPTSGC